MITFLLSFFTCTIIFPLYFLFFPDCWNKCIHHILFNFLKIKHKFIKKSHLIPHGYILANHRCFLDFAVDPYFSKSSVLGRYFAFFAVSFISLCGFKDKRIIPFHRGKKNANQVLQIIKKHRRLKNKYSSRILFYPEGTRQKYKSLNSPSEFKGNYLKYGLLKRIWEEGVMPVQLMITGNKEHVFNEKKWTIRFGVEVKTVLGEPLYPVDYDDFGGFVDAIAEQWVEYYNEVLDD